MVKSILSRRLNVSSLREVSHKQQREDHLGNQKNARICFMVAHKLRNPVTESTTDTNHKKAKLGQAEEKAISEQLLELKIEEAREST